MTATLMLGLGRVGSIPPVWAYNPYEIGRGISAFVGGEHVIAGSRSFLESLGVEVPPDRMTNGTTVHVASRGQYIGCIWIADAVRTSATAAVRALEHMKIRVIFD
jgi:cation transport ATPase